MWKVKTAVLTLTLTLLIFSLDWNISPSNPKAIQRPVPEDATGCELISHNTGRLGNQMLQYATMRMLAERHNKTPCMSQVKDIFCPFICM